MLTFSKFCVLVLNSLWRRNIIVEEEEIPFSATKAPAPHQNTDLFFSDLQIQYMLFVCSYISTVGAYREPVHIVIRVYLFMSEPINLCRPRRGRMEDLPWFQSLFPSWLKVKKLKYHQYIPPDQKADKERPPQMDSSYAKLLQQQQLFLQLQILNQQQQHYNYHTILPAPPKLVWPGA